MSEEDAALKQQAYYESTADKYEVAHVHSDDEHMRALAMFEGFARKDNEHPSILDIGSGTGRGVRRLKTTFPEGRIVGIEPVRALREIGYQNGLRGDELVDGDATALPFEDDSFDWVIETGVLHHIRDFKKAVGEMVRVARLGVLISDSNNIGQGSSIARAAKRVIRRTGLWPTVVWLQTRGKGYKYSDGDGVYYSFCAFDCVPVIRNKFRSIYCMNTMPNELDLYRGASHVALLGLK